MANIALAQEGTNDVYVIDDPVKSSVTVKDDIIRTLPPIATEAGLGRPLIPVKWASANTQYRRLYFEEKLLERHGRNRGELKTNLRSATRFFSRAISWPITSRLFRPNDLQSPYSMGRPGSSLSR